jgi:hypothetical protein
MTDGTGTRDRKVASSAANFAPDRPSDLEAGTAAPGSGHAADQVAGSSGSSASDGWPVRAADFVEQFVGLVRDRAVRPVIVAGRAFVFGILVGVMGLVLAVLTAVAAVRLFDVYVFRGRAWASEALFGTLFLSLGTIAWSFRRPRNAKEST